MAYMTHKCILQNPILCHDDFTLTYQENKVQQAQHRAAVETAARINCTSDTFGTYFYGFHCTSELRLFLTQFKCKCKHKSPAICHIDVLLMYERCLPGTHTVP